MHSGCFLSVQLSGENRLKLPASLALSNSGTSTDQRSAEPARVLGALAPLTLRTVLEPLKLPLGPWGFPWGAARFRPEALQALG